MSEIVINRRRDRRGGRDFRTSTTCRRRVQDMSSTSHDVSSTSHDMSSTVPGTVHGDYDPIFKIQKFSNIFEFSTAFFRRLGGDLS